MRSRHLKKIMRDDISDIERYYDGVAYDEDSRLERHQLERDITLRYLAEYIPPSSNILEIGAGTGAYTLWLARRGHRITAVDLSKTLSAKCRERASREGLDASIKCHVADARDLSFLAGRTYDAVILMGPLYHLILEQDRHQAVQESYRRLRPGGMFFSALVSRYGIIGDLVRRNPRWIENRREVRSVIEHGYNSENPREGGFRGYYTTAEEARSLHERAGLQTLVLAGVEPAVSMDDGNYNRLEGNQRKLWLELLHELSREPTLVASSIHLLYVGRKPAE